MNRADQAAPVRRGEALDIDNLERYLCDHLPGARGPLVIEQFPSGYSNLTYLLRLGEQELVLRRPPLGVAIKSAHDMGREFRVLSGLSTVYTKAPRPLLYCDDEAIIGAPFYLMARLHGVILRGDRQPGGHSCSRLRRCRARCAWPAGGLRSAPDRGVDKTVSCCADG